MWAAAPSRAVCAMNLPCRNTAIAICHPDPQAVLLRGLRRRDLLFTFGSTPFSWFPGVAENMAHLLLTLGSANGYTAEIKCAMASSNVTFPSRYGCQ